MILKVIFLIICWVIILFIKKGRFAEFISDFRSSDKPVWKIWAALFYKSPWFFVTFIGNFLALLGIMADKHKNLNLMFNSTISYAIPLAIWVWGINGPQKGKSGDKNFVRGFLIIFNICDIFIIPGNVPKPMPNRYPSWKFADLFFHAPVHFACR